MTDEGDPGGGVLCGRPALSWWSDKGDDIVLELIGEIRETERF